MRHKVLLVTLGIAVLAVVGYLNWTLLANTPSPVPIMPGASNVMVEDNYKLGRVDGMLTSYTVDEPTDAVHKFYRAALPGMGWPYVAPGTYSPLDSIASALEVPATSFRLYGNSRAEFGIPNSAALIVSQQEGLTYVRVFSYSGRTGPPSLNEP